MKHLHVLGVTFVLATVGMAEDYDTNHVVVQTYAGSGFYGLLDGNGAQTMFGGPSAVAVDSSGSAFVLDAPNYRIRKITPGGDVTTFVGRDIQGGYNATNPPTGYGMNVALPYSFGGMGIDRADSLWFVGYYDGHDYLIRVEPEGRVTRPITNHVWMDKRFYNAVCVDSLNRVYFSAGNIYTATGHVIYRYVPTSETVEVFAGSGNRASVDGYSVFSSFSCPTALACDAADNIYVWEADTHLIRRITPDRKVVTIAGRVAVDIDGVGTNAGFKTVYAMGADHLGNILLACGESVRRMSASTNVTTIAGSFTEIGYAEGAGGEARFRSARGVCSSPSGVLIADYADYRIRRICFDLAPEPVHGGELLLRLYPGVQISGVAGRTYRIESCIDSATWVPEATILLTTTPYEWIDRGTNAQKKLYRAFLLP